MAPLDEQVRAGDAVLLRYEGGDRFAVTGLSEDRELEREGFPRFLLAERGDAGQRALLGFHDFWNCDRVWVSKTLALALTGIVEVRGSPADDRERPSPAPPAGPVAHQPTHRHQASPGTRDSCPSCARGS